MRQVWITKKGSPEVLKVLTAPDPEPSPTQLRVRVHAAGICFADILTRMGVYPDAPELPAVVGYEVCGEVDRVGASVQGFNVGDKVIGLCHFGGYSERIVLSPHQVFRLPEGMTYSEGAAIPVNYLTVYQMLFVMGSVRPGDKVLIHSAAGGIGNAAIDLCAVAGAESMGIASASKHRFLRERGLRHVFDSKSRDLVSEVLEITQGQGVQLVLDPIGGKSWANSLDCLGPTGRLALFGISSAAPSKRRQFFPLIKTLFTTPWLRFNPVSLINSNKGVFGINLGHLWHHQDKLRLWAEEVLSWCREGRIHPLVDREFSFEEAALAHHYIQDRKNIGKVVLVP